MKRFFISRLSSLGDVTCSLGVAVALKKSFPNCFISWAVAPPFKGIVESCIAVNDIQTIQLTPSPKTWKINQEEYDVAFDLQGLFKSGILVHNTKAKNKLGYFWQRECSGLFSRKVIPQPSSFHVMDQYMDVARVIGALNPDMESWLRPTPEAIQKINTFHLPNSYAVLNAGAGWEIKRWPPEYFAELSEKLLEKGIHSVFIGGPAAPDREAFEQVKSCTKADLIDLIGKTSSAELVALLSQACLHIGGDTGSTHISSALRIPCVSMYSPTHPTRTGPYHYRDSCIYHPNSLRDISIDQVWDKIKEFII